MENQIFSVTGLTCDACAKLVKKRLEKLSGVNEVDVDKNNQKLSIMSETEVFESELNAALIGTDYRINA